MKTILIFFVFFLYVSCAEKGKSPNVSEFTGKIETQVIDSVTLGDTKYKRRVIKGINRVFDAIKENDGSFLIMQLEPRKILKFNSRFEFIKWIGASKEGDFSLEWQSPDSYFGDALPPESAHSEPHSFVLDPRTPKVITVAYYGRADNKNANTISQYDLEKGNFLASFGMSEDKEFSNGFTADPKLPRGKVFFRGVVNGSYDKENNLYVSDYTNCTLTKFDSNYKFKGWIGGKDTGEATDGWSTQGTPKCTSIPGGFNRLHGIAFDSKGNIYVADTGNNRIQKFNQEGKFQGWMGVKEDGKPTGGWEKTGKAIASQALGGFNAPIAIKIDREDNIYLLEVFGSRLQKMTLAGKHLWALTDLKESYGLQVYDDEFIISDTGNQRVVVFTKE